MLYNYEIFRNNLKAIRQSRGLSEDKLAIQADIHYSTYCSIEKGRRNPSIKNVISLANALNISIASLIDDKIDADNTIEIENILCQLRSISDKNLLNGVYQLVLLIKTREVRND